MMELRLALQKLGLGLLTAKTSNAARSPRLWTLWTRAKEEQPAEPTSVHPKETVSL